MLRVEYHEALDSVRTDVIQLGALVVDALHFAVKAFKERDTALAGRIIADDQIDSRRRRIEQACLDLFWRQQPVANELREVSAIHEVATDLGIIMQHVDEIAKQAIRAAGTEAWPDLSAACRVDDLTEAAVKDALRAFETRDKALAESLYPRANEIEECYTPDIEGIQAAMQGHPELIAGGIALLFKLTALQRIAERAENIAWHTEEML